MELGVFKGGTAAVLGSECRRSPYPRHLWLFDSFQGLPVPRPEDGKEAAQYAGGRDGGEMRPIGECVGTRADVEHFLFGPAGLVKAAVTLVEGWYQDTLRSPDVGEICRLHVDCDWYESVKLALESPWERVVPGGCVVLDDYGDWAGARRALHEFLGAQAIESTLHRGGHTQAYFWKN